MAPWERTNVNHSDENPDENDVSCSVNGDLSKIATKSVTVETAVKLDKVEPQVEVVIGDSNSQ